MTNDPRSTRAPERRTAERQQLGSPVRIRIETPELAGEAENLSSTGILFFTDGDLCVEVEVEDDGVVRRLHGHLVRCERIEGNRRGWAVEFDRH